MVATIDEVLDMRKHRSSLEEMNKFDRDICGAEQAKHLIIPMRSPYDLRRFAGILNSVAADFENLSRRQDLRARTIILEARAVMDDANRRIREIAGKVKRNNRTE